MGEPVPADGERVGEVAQVGVVLAAAVLRKPVQLLNQLFT